MPQAAIRGPGARWANWIPPEVIEQRERAVEANPEDVCACGDLASHLWQRESAFSHMLWMVKHHPEWDGFYLPPPLRGAHINEALRDAWLDVQDSRRPQAIALYNAAHFFEFDEPERALELLKRAITLEPDESIFHSGIGRIYGLALVSSADLRVKKLFPRWNQCRSEAAVQDFAERAIVELSRSQDPDVVSGALSVFANYRGGNMAPSGHNPGQYAPFVFALEAWRAGLGPSRRTRYGASACEVTQSPKQAPGPPLPR